MPCLCEREVRMCSTIQSPTLKVQNVFAHKNLLVGTSLRKKAEMCLKEISHKHVHASTTSMALTWCQFEHSVSSVIYFCSFLNVEFLALKSKRQDRHFYLWQDKAGIKFSIRLGKVLNAKEEHQSGGFRTLNVLFSKLFLASEIDIDRHIDRRPIEILSLLELLMIVISSKVST